MKRLFEGATVVSAILLLLTTASAFIFNIQTQKAKSKRDRKVEKIIEDHEQRHRDSVRRLQEENEDLRKEKDPFWHYYDPEKGEFNTLPGKYGVDDPPPRPRGY